MRILSTLLGASLLLNLALLAGRAGSADPLPPAARHAVSDRRGPADATEESALQERSKARVEPLERGKAGGDIDSGPPKPRSDGFREKLVRVLRQWKDPRVHAGTDPEALLELSEVTLAFQRARFDRFKDPRGYVDVLRTVLEQAASDGKRPLGEEQKEAMKRAFEEYETAISGLESPDSWERFSRELGPEADVLQKLRAFVSPEQEARVMAFGGLSPWSASTAPWIERRHAEPNVVQQWMTAYGLDESHRNAVTAAARIYLNGADSLNAQMGGAALPGRDSAEWRRRSGRLLLEALGYLEGSLGAEPRERLRGRRPAEVRVYDGVSQQFYAR